MFRWITLLPAMLLACAPVPAMEVRLTKAPGLTGLRFLEQVKPLLPAGAVVYRLYGEKLAGAGVQPDYQALGGGWHVDYMTPADGKSWRGRPGSGLPWIAIPLEGDERYQAGFALDFKAVTIDSDAVGAEPGATMRLVSAAEAGKNAGLAYWVFGDRVVRAGS
jgi:hypothetical protein